MEHDYHIWKNKIVSLENALVAVCYSTTYDNNDCMWRKQRTLRNLWKNTDHWI